MRVWKKAIFFIDLTIMAFTILYFIYTLIPLLYALSGANVDRPLFDRRNANIFGVLFVYVLLKSAFAFILYVILKIKCKKTIFFKNIKSIFPWILFSVLIFSLGIALVIMKSYDSKSNLLYSLVIIIGTFLWLNIMIYENNLNSMIKRYFLILNLLGNYLLILIGYIISIY
jgi:hypothetical protein